MKEFELKEISTPKGKRYIMTCNNCGKSTFIPKLIYEREKLNLTKGIKLRENKKKLFSDEPIKNDKEKDVFEELFS